MVAVVIFDGEAGSLIAMNIAATTLLEEATLALHWWPEIAREEAAVGLPSGVLLAVGSRETNLNPRYLTEPGDGGHGRGLFQLDDRWHTIPDNFTVELQAQRAAEMLEASRMAGHSWVECFNIYNSGSPWTMDTTGEDYGPDVFARAAYLHENLLYGSTSEQEWEMADSPVAQDIQARLARIEKLLDNAEKYGGGRIIWRLGQVLNMLQRQIELGVFKRPPSYVEWHDRENAWTVGAATAHDDQGSTGQGRHDS